MADLTEAEASGSTKLIGADPTTGAETNFADVTAEGELKISSFANVTFADANRTITTTELLANVSGSNLANRKSLIVFNRGTSDVFYGTTGVSDTTGIAVVKDEILTLLVGDNIDVFLVTKTGSSTVTIQEFA